MSPEPPRGWGGARPASSGSGRGFVRFGRARRAGIPRAVPPEGRRNGGSSPVEGLVLPEVGVPDAQDQEEDDHLAEERRAAGPEDERPWVEERDLDVEQDEDHRDQKELDRDPLPGGVEERHAALVRIELAARSEAGAQHGRKEDPRAGESDRGGD